MSETKPLYIVFEGGEGSGKSTQSRLLAEKLGKDTVQTFEPGGNKLGSQIRSILLDPETGDLDPITEVYMMAADRAELMKKVVAPALNQLFHVVSDRNFISSIAYQGAGRGMGEQFVLDVNLLNPNLLVPDLAIILDSPSPEHLASRLKARPDRLEAAGDEFHRKVASSYGRMARILAENERTADIKIVTIGQEIAGQPKSIDTLHSEVLEGVSTYCKERDVATPV